METAAHIPTGMLVRLERTENDEVLMVCPHCASTDHIVEVTETGQHYELAARYPDEAHEQPPVIVGYWAGSGPKPSKPYTYCGACGLARVSLPQPVGEYR